MKTLVVTVYNSHNSGSFLQAYATQLTLKKLGYEVGFLKRQNSGSHSIKLLIIQVVKHLCRFHIGKAINEIEIWFAFEKLSKKYMPAYEMCSEYYAKTDSVILGSDTIWNFDNPYFLKDASTYLGTIFKGKKVISYAASAANTSFERFYNTVTACGGIGHLSSILVRDSYTESLVKGITEKQVHLVTDPTLLLTAEDYLPLQRYNKIHEPYLLLYYFGKVHDDLKKSIVKFAKENKLKVVSMPFNRSWCDRSFNQIPFNMITYFSGASAVITNTFHGCAFSILYGKKFAVHDEGKRKISDFLNMYDEGKRLFTLSSDIFELLETRQQSNSLLVETIRQECLKILTTGINQ